MASRHVVLGYDGSSKAKSASDRAIALAQAREDTDIVLVCAHERPPDFSGSLFLLGSIDETRWRREWERETAEDLKHEATRIRLAGVEATVTCTPDDPSGCWRTSRRRSVPSASWCPTTTGACFTT